MQMGMMKELVRGPIKCCETLAQDMLYKLRAEELLYHAEFNPVESISIPREKLDKLPGNSLSRFVGSPRTHTEHHFFLDMLRVFLDRENEMLEDLGWEPDDYSHEDLIIQEYCKVAIGNTAYITAEWSSPIGSTTCNSFMYYVRPRSVFDKDAEEPNPPSLEELESMDKPPSDYQHDFTDFYFHSYVGQVLLLLLLDVEMEGVAVVVVVGASVDSAGGVDVGVACVVFVGFGGNVVVAVAVDVACG